MAAQIEHRQATESKEDLLEVLQRDGVVILEGLVTPEQLQRMNRELDPFMSEAATTVPEMNPLLQMFYGDKTRRMGALPAKSRTFCDVLTHPLLAEICEEILLKAGSSYQMNVAQVLEVGPEAVAQFLHRDEDVWPHMPKPCPTFQIASMTALTDFTEEIGATCFVPGSHLWEDRSREAQAGEVAIAEMPAGSMALYLGSTIHGAGTNRTADRWRRGIHLSFIVGWIRTEENNYLNIPMEVARDLPERVQALLGYQMHDAIDAGGGVAGSVEFRDPMVLLREQKFGT
jgi:hypothetical protein